MNFGLRHTFSRIAARSLPFATLLSVAACKDDPRSDITLQVGPDQILHLSPTSGYAQYFELPGQKDILRIVLSSYPLRCPHFEPPGPGQVYISVTVEAESGHSFQGEEIHWEGIPTSALPQEKDEKTTKTDQPEPKIWALPMIRLFEEARPLPPGGYVSLSKFAREPYGVIEGEFHFSDAGEGEAATAALLGPFRVQLCHVDLDPARAAESESQQATKGK